MCCQAEAGDQSVVAEGKTVTLMSCSHCKQLVCSDCLECNATCSECIDNGALDGIHLEGQDDGDGSVDAELQCSICHRVDEDDTMLICDGCDGGFHMACLGMLGSIPAGDWFCSDCRQLARARRFLAAKGLLNRQKWLSVRDLPFAVGDFVAVFYPTRVHASVQYGLVTAIGVQSHHFRDRLAVRLQDWPQAHTGWPYFALQPATQSDTEWEEQQEFWPFIHKVSSKPHKSKDNPTVALIDRVAQAQLSAWAEEFAGS